MPAYPRRLNSRGDSPSRRFPKSTPHQSLRDSFPPRGSLKRNTTFPILARGSSPPYTSLFRGVSREIPRRRNVGNRTRQPQILAGGGSPPRQPTCLWRLALEKSPAGETKTNVHDNPKHLPAVAHRLARGGSPSPEQKTSPRKERFSGVCNISFSRFYLILPFFILPHVARAGTYARSDVAAAINNYRTFAERTPAGARTRDRLPEPTYPYARNRS